jgi:hypothetical protein
MGTVAAQLLYANTGALRGIADLGSPRLNSNLSLEQSHNSEFALEFSVISSGHDITALGTLRGLGPLRSRK